MGVRFADAVRWRVSQRGLVIAGTDDAALLEHPRAASLPEFLADAPDAVELARRLGPPRASTLVEEMRAAGILVDGPPRADDPSGAARSDPRRRAVVLTRSGAEFPGIERPARWLDRRVVPLLVSWPGRLVLAAVVLAGVVALARGRPAGPTVSAHPAVDALLGLGVMLVMSALHEFAHAVALVHYGRRPRRAGFGFYWGGISFYVDSTEALTLPRRARVIQALVGLAVDVVSVSVLAVVAQLGATTLVVAVCWRLAVVGLVDVVVNLSPILEVDGHWALADLIDEPELAPRARVALGARLLGTRPPAGEAPAGARWLPAYGALSLVGGIALLVSGALVWWTVAADLVRALFGGSTVDVVVGAVLVGPLVLSLLLSSLGLVLDTVLSARDPLVGDDVGAEDSPSGRAGGRG